LGILLAFEQNQSWIVENKCVNRDRPVMKCNGSCHLRKQLEASEQQEGEAEVPVVYQLNPVQEWLHEEKPLPLMAVSDIWLRFSMDRHDPLPHPCQCEVFRPPEDELANG
jgi:hypothetical protein